MNVLELLVIIEDLSNEYGYALIRLLRVGFVMRESFYSGDLGYILLKKS